MQRSPHEARRWWEHAAHLYAEIDEREGRARCLQHLGSADVAAGRLASARELLEQSELLRTSESELLTKYLDAARQAVDPPVVIEEPPRRTATDWLKRLVKR